MSLFFFFNDTATTEIYTLSLHDALPISVHAARQGQPGLVDGGAKRWRALRPAGAVSLPQAEPGLRPDPDRQSDQPGYRHLSPDLAVGPAWLRGDPRQPARHPDRGVAHLRAAALPAGRGRAHP